MGIEASYDEARHNLEAARRRLESAQEKAARVLAGLGGDLKRPVEMHPSFLAASAARDAGRDELARVRVVAPAAGIVSNMRLQPGERVERGVPVFSLIESRPVWIEANFKETQLTHMRIGQPVEIHADVYGGDVTYQGRVQSLGVGTGSAFSLLPAQNATGNWIKIVQRVPVRVTFTDPRQLDAHPLRIGLSTDVSVNLHDQRGAMLARQPPSKPAFSTDVYERQLHQADDLIAQIVHANMAGNDR
jgi:membrane fusion protein, multidrug efflux system